MRLSRRRLVEGEFVEHSDPQPVIYLRVSKDEAGKLGVREAVMLGGEPISAASWRDVPFDTAALFASGVGDKSAPPLLAAIGEQLDGEDSVPSLADALDALFPEDAESAVVIAGASAPSGKLAALKTPDAGLTDEFLTDLAAAYSELSAAKRAPAPAIAEQTCAPVRTVHGWIAEARKRGYLAPARREKAG